MGILCFNSRGNMHMILDGLKKRWKSYWGHWQFGHCWKYSDLNGYVIEMAKTEI